MKIIFSYFTFSISSCDDITVGFLPSTTKWICFVLAIHRMAISSLPTAIPFFKNNSYYPMIIMCASRLYSMAAHNIFTHKHETPHESWLGPAIVVRIGLIVSLLAFIHLLCTHNLREAHRHTNTKSHKCVLMCCALWQVKAYRWVCL